MLSAFCRRSRQVSRDVLHALCLDCCNPNHTDKATASDDRNVAANTLPSNFMISNGSVAVNRNSITISFERSHAMESLFDGDCETNGIKSKQPHVSVNCIDVKM